MRLRMATVTGTQCKKLALLYLLVSLVPCSVYCQKSGTSSAPHTDTGFRFKSCSGTFIGQMDQCMDPFLRHLTMLFQGRSRTSKFFYRAFQDYYCLKYEAMLMCLHQALTSCSDPLTTQLVQLRLDTPWVPYVNIMCNINMAASMKVLNQSQQTTVNQLHDRSHDTHRTVHQSEAETHEEGSSSNVLQESSDRSFLDTNHIPRNVQNSEVQTGGSSASRNWINILKKLVSKKIDTQIPSDPHTYSSFRRTQGHLSDTLKAGESLQQSGRSSSDQTVRITGNNKFSVSFSQVSKTRSGAWQTQIGQLMFQRHLPFN